MSKPQGLSSNFSPLTRDESKKALQESIDLQASIMLWREGEEPRTESTLYTLSPAEGTFSIRVPEGVKPDDLREYLFNKPGAQKGSEESINDEFYFSVSIPRALFFFKTKLMSYGVKKIEFKIPTVLYKVQRREHMRLPSSINPTLWVELKHPRNPGQTLLKRLGDISAGGLSFFLSNEESSLFSADQILSGIKIYNGHEYITATAKVVHVKPVSKPESPDEVFRVGITYTEITAKDRQLIQTFVFQETRKYFSKFL